MRPIKTPGLSPVFEKLLQSRMRETQKTISEAKQRVEEARKTVEKAQELAAHLQRRRH